MQKKTIYHEKKYDIGINKIFQISLPIAALEGFDFL